MLPEVFTLVLVCVSWQLVYIQAQNACNDGDLSELDFTNVVDLFNIELDSGKKNELDKLYNPTGEVFHLLPNDKIRITFNKPKTISGMNFTSFLPPQGSSFIVNMLDSKKAEVFTDEKKVPSDENSKINDVLFPFANNVNNIFDVKTIDLVGANGLQGLNVTNLQVKSCATPLMVQSDDTCPDGFILKPNLDMCQSLDFIEFPGDNICADRNRLCKTSYPLKFKTPVKFHSFNFTLELADPNLKEFFPEEIQVHVRCNNPAGELIGNASSVKVKVTDNASHQFFIREPEGLADVSSIEIDFDVGDGQAFKLQNIELEICVPDCDLAEQVDFSDPNDVTIQYLPNAEPALRKSSSRLPIQPNDRLIIKPNQPSPVEMIVLNTTDVDTITVQATLLNGTNLDVTDIINDGDKSIINLPEFEPISSVNVTFGGTEPDMSTQDIAVIGNFCGCDDKLNANNLNELFSVRHVPVRDANVGNIFPVGPEVDLQRFFAPKPNDEIWITLDDEQDVIDFSVVSIGLEGDFIEATFLDKKLKQLRTQKDGPLLPANSLLHPFRAIKDTPSINIPKVKHILLKFDGPLLKPQIFDAKFQTCDPPTNDIPEVNGTCPTGYKMEFLKDICSMEGDFFRFEGEESLCTDPRADLNQKSYMLAFNQPVVFRNMNITTENVKGLVTKCMNAAREVIAEVSSGDPQSTLEDSQQFLIRDPAGLSNVKFLDIEFNADGPFQANQLDLELCVRECKGTSIKNINFKNADCKVKLRLRNHGFDPSVKDILDDPAESEPKDFNLDSGDSVVIKPVRPRKIDSLTFKTSDIPGGNNVTYRFITPEGEQINGIQDKDGDVFTINVPDDSKNKNQLFESVELTFRQSNNQPITASDLSVNGLFCPNRVTDKEEGYFMDYKAKLKASKIPKPDHCREIDILHYIRV